MVNVFRADEETHNRLVAIAQEDTKLVKKMAYEYFNLSNDEKENIRNRIKFLRAERDSLISGIGKEG